MLRRVAIVGVYQTKFESAKSGQTLEELIYHSVQALLKNTEITIKDIDSIVTASSDQIDGRAISMMLTSSPTGAEMKDLINSSGAGEHALILAYLRILSGVFETSLVVNWTKCSEIQLPQVEHLGCDPFYERDIGLTSLIANALQACTYVNRYELPEEIAAKVVEKNRKNAVNNPYAHLQKEVTVDEVLQSKMLSWPLRELEVPPQSDGVCAVVLASEEKAHFFSNNYAWIRGIGWNTDTYWMGDRDLTQMTSLSLAAESAYAMAGIRNPKEEIAVAELHDISAYHELMEYEALGFCGKGEGASLIEKGITNINGALPVNPSGGTLSSNPIFASGSVRVIEAALQVMGKAEKRQVNAKTALAQASSGFAGQNNSVFILEGGRQ